MVKDESHEELRNYAKATRLTSNAYQRKENKTKVKKNLAVFAAIYVLSYYGRRKVFFQ